WSSHEIERPTLRVRITGIARCERSCEPLAVFAHGTVKSQRIVICHKHEPYRSSFYYNVFALYVASGERESCNRDLRMRVVCLLDQDLCEGGGRGFSLDRAEPTARGGMITVVLELLVEKLYLPQRRRTSQQRDD
ncbi:MAG: hypothetical protein O7D97_02625, partial [Planctomycetota bacterium]|nr:hypothetical protein [Planctomycetota bacterium]